MLKVVMAALHHITLVSNHYLTLAPPTELRSWPRRAETSCGVQISVEQCLWPESGPRPSGLPQNTSSAPESPLPENTGSRKHWLFLWLQTDRLWNAAGSNLYWMICVSSWQGCGRTGVWVKCSEQWMIPDVTMMMCNKSSWSYITL